MADVRHSRKLLWLACIASLVPILLVDIAPLCDLPNHLARIHLLATGHDGGFYEFEWAWLPNLAIDTIATPLADLLDAEFGVRVFLCATVLMTVLGAAWCAHGLGHDAGIAGALASLCVHNIAFEYGLVNYAFGIGLMLVAFATWVHLRDRRFGTRVFASSAMAIALAGSHLMALAFYATLVAAFELAHRFMGRVRGESILRQTLCAAAQFVVPACIYFGLSPARGEAASWVMPSLEKKLSQLAGMFVIGPGPWDLVFTAGFAAVFAGLWIVARPRLDPRSVLAIAAMLAVFAIAPQKTATADNISIRVPPAIALVVAALVGWRTTNPRKRTVLVIALAALLGVRHVQIANDWIRSHETYPTIRGAARSIPDGSTVFTLRDSYHRREIRNTWDPPLAHAACLTILERDVYVPQLFANHGQQLLVIRDEALVAMRFPRGDFMPTYESPDDRRQWIDEFARLHRASNPRPGSKACVLELHRVSPEVTDPRLTTLGRGQAWTLWLVDG